MTALPRDPAPFDWNNEMRMIETRLDDHLTDAETAARLAQLDRLTAPLHREPTWHGWLSTLLWPVCALLFVALAVAVLR